MNVLTLVDFTVASHLSTEAIKRMILNLADEFCFSFLIHRVLLVLLVPLVLLVQEVLVYVHGDD